MSLTAYIGSKLYYIGYRMQPPSIRRGLSLMSQIGLLWSETHPDILLRAMRGEKLNLGIDLRTQELPSDQRGTENGY